MLGQRNTLGQWEYNTVMIRTPRLVSSHDVSASMWTGSHQNAWPGFLTRIYTGLRQSLIAIEQDIYLVLNIAHSRKSNQQPYHSAYSMASHRCHFAVA
jgi:hypothetical protein